MTLPAPTRYAARRAAMSPRRSPVVGSVILRLLIVLGGLGVLVLWWIGSPSELAPGTLLRHGATPAAALTAIGELTAMLAGLLICVQILLVARVPWFERAVGMDHLVRWHRTLGTTVLLLVLTHVSFNVWGGVLREHRDVWSVFWWTTLVQPEVLRAAIGTVLLMVVGISSVQIARRRLSYELWYWLHTTTYVAVFLTFGHQIHAGAHFVGDTSHQVLWTVLYLGTAATVLAWRVVPPLRTVVRHRVRVEKVVAETEDVASIWLRGAHLAELRTRAGQFFLFRFLTRGHLWTAHPYSVSLLPQRNRMRITVGAVGDHSAAITKIAPGTLVLMEGPFGRFTADRARTSKILLVAGGAGIGPIRTLAHDLKEQGRDVVVIHRAHSAEHLPLVDELMALAGITFLPVLGRRRDLGHDPLAAESILRLVPDIRLREVFLCGSPGLCTALTSTLRTLGVPGRHIHREELSLS